MPDWLEAGLWGLVAGGALLVGTTLGYFANPANRVTAAAMAFGSGLLISAVAFELMDEAYAHAGLAWSAWGMLGGALVYSAVNVLLARQGAKHRKRSRGLQPSEQEQPGSGVVLALGSMWDGVPEAMTIGLSMLGGEEVQLVAVASIALSNVPEGLSSAAGMRRAGRRFGYVFGLFAAVAVASGLASVAGYAVVGGLPANVVALILSAAAGAVLAMIVDTMLPEAFAETHELAGIIASAGFVVAYSLSKFAE